MVAGVKVRWPCKAQDQFMEVAEACEGRDAAFAWLRMAGVSLQPTWVPAAVPCIWAGWSQAALP